MAAVRKTTGAKPGIVSTLLLNWRLLVWPIIGALFVWQSSLQKANVPGTSEAPKASVRKGVATSTVVTKRPFDMPLEGEKYKIFQPILDMEGLEPQLFSTADYFISSFTKRANWVNTMVANPPEGSTEDYAKSMYIETMKNVVSAMIFGDKEKSVHGYLGPGKKNADPFNPNERKVGADWAYLGDTMTGWNRLDNVRDLLIDVIKNNIEGGYIETGVWRGGSSILARAVLAAYGEAEKRISYVCDSFAGLPPGDRSLDTADKNWDNTPYLEVASEIVASSFNKYGLLDNNVVFAKGFFNETMPVLSKHVDKLAVMRLDGDMYESTVDVLYQLYDKLSVGGYVIMDDWYGFPSKTACEDFFKVHGFNPEIIQIDRNAAYWKKTEEVTIQKWRYEQNKFKEGDTQS